MTIDAINTSRIGELRQQATIRVCVLSNARVPPRFPAPGNVRSSRAGSPHNRRPYCQRADRLIIDAASMVFIPFFLPFSLNFPGEVHAIGASPPARPVRLGSARFGSARSAKGRRGHRSCVRVAGSCGLGDGRSRSVIASALFCFPRRFQKTDRRCEHLRKGCLGRRLDGTSARSEGFSRGSGFPAWKSVGHSCPTAFPPRRIGRSRTGVRLECPSGFSSSLRSHHCKSRSALLHVEGGFP